MTNESFAGRRFGFDRARAALAAATLGAVAMVAPLAAMAPEPDPVPRRWQFDLKIGDLRLAKVTHADGAVGSYFYLNYSVTNGTKEDLLLAPQWELATDEGEVIRSGRDVPAEVTEAIKTRLGNPLVQDQISILGTLLQGEENARDGVVIWKANDLNVDELAVYATGFSGETKEYTVKEPESGKPRRELLRKTMMLRYDVPGDIEARGNTPFLQAERRWIMR